MERTHYYTNLLLHKMLPKMIDTNAKSHMCLQSLSPISFTFHLMKSIKSFTNDYFNWLQYTYCMILFDNMQHWWLAPPPKKKTPLDSRHTNGKKNHLDCPKLVNTTRSIQKINLWYQKSHTHTNGPFGGRKKLVWFCPQHITYYQEHLSGHYLKTSPKASAVVSGPVAATHKISTENKKLACVLHTKKEYPFSTS